MSDQILGTQEQGIYSDLKNQIEQLLILLSERERFVIERRFALDSNEKATLEEIGQSYQVTRERVRQIEKNALHKLKRNIDNYLLADINNRAFVFIDEAGGVIREDYLMSKLISESEGYSFSAILFVLSLDKRFERCTNTINFLPYFRNAGIKDGLIDDICKISVDLLDDRKDLVDLEEVLKVVVNKFGSVISKETLESILFINKQIKVVKEKVGLIKWKHINPRTLRDKIFYVLRKAGKPIHFVDISNSIINGKFDKKNVNIQAVHNELIRYPEFILIGRGIYALKEWGYWDGTVEDVIKEVLSNKDALTVDEVIEEVLKYRQVKPITVILNLKNKPQFVRVGRKRYSLKKK